jgi:hypothetical protein
VCYCFLNSCHLRRAQSAALPFLHAGQDSFFRYKQLAHSIGAPYIHNEVRDLLCHARKRSEKRIWSLATRTSSGRETSFSQKHNNSPTRSEGAGWVTDSMKSLGAGSYDMAKIITPATLRCNLMPGDINIPKTDTKGKGG